MNRGRAANRPGSWVVPNFGVLAGLSQRCLWSKADVIRSALIKFSKRVVSSSALPPSALHCGPGKHGLCTCHNQTDFAQFFLALTHCAVPSQPFIMVLAWDRRFKGTRKGPYLVQTSLHAKWLPTYIYISGYVPTVSA